MSWRLGPYRVEDRPLASGATAEVFAARTGRTGSRVAIKVLPLRTYRERAEAEAQTATIDHPRLISVHETVVDERRGVVGLVMDLADGDLRNALRGSNAPSPIEMIQIADDLLAALEALHERGFVHRDIKPENVLLERVDGRLRARLGDLGIARALDRTRSTGSVLGTDLYIAPEVHDGGAPSVAADIWAVGYVLYEGLFGAPPHADAATTYQAIGRLRSDGPDRPPNVPDAIWRVVATLLAPDPSARPMSAAAARDLVATGRAVATGASAGPRLVVELVRPAPLRRRIGEQSSRLPRFVAAAVASVIAVGGVAFAGSNGSIAWFGSSPQAHTISSVTPLSPASRAVVPTQYQWRLQDGVLTGRLNVTNPTGDTTAATEMPELFPPSAVSDGTLNLVGFNGKTQKQTDGSVLVRFAVPPLAPRAHHVVAFRLRVPAASELNLDTLVRDREAAINRHAFSLSDAPTLDRFTLTPQAATLRVGQQAALALAGVTHAGDAAPASLLKDVRYEIVSGTNAVRIDGVTVLAVAPGAAVVRAVIGDLHADTVITVEAPPTTLTPTTAKRRPPVTTTTTVYVEPSVPIEDDVIV